MKKSIVISLLTVATLFCTALCSFAATGIVTTDTLRVRKSASTNATIVGLLSIDDKVEVLGEENGWYKIKAEIDSEEIEGYVSKEYLKVAETQSAGNEPEEQTETATEPETETENQNETSEEENKVKEEQTNTEEETEGQQDKKMVKILPAETKIYVTPVINSVILDTLKEETQIEIISEINEWTYMSTGNIKGWIRTENITEKEASETEQNNTSSQKTGYISGNSVNFRKEASTSSEVITKLLKNTQVKVLSEEGDWSKVEINGQVGYVSSSYVSDKKVATTSRKTSSRTQTTAKTETQTQEEETTSTSSQGSATGSEIVAYAKKYLGSKYVYGGSSPSGFDCSGFTCYVYKHFGYTLSRSSSAQSSNGTAVSKSDLQAGDIICFSRSSGSSSIGHVGIYIGGGKFIHAANSRKGVIISNVSGDGYYYVCARRII